MDRGRFHRLAAVIEATAVFVVLYQALRVLFSTLFGLIYDTLFAGTASLVTVGAVLAVLIVALLVPLAAPRQSRGRRIALLAGAVLVFLARIPLTLDNPQVRLAASILIVAGAGLYLAARLRQGARVAVRALIVALIVDQLLRVMGQTWDVTLRPAWLAGQIVVSVLLCVLAGWLFRRRSPRDETVTGGWGLSLALFWGGWLFLQTSLLNFANALSHWSGQNYLLFAIGAPLLLLLALVGDEHWTMRRGWLDGVLYGAVLLLGLTAAYLATGLWAILGLAAAQFACLKLIFSCLLARRQDPADRLGLGLALGGILFLVLSFAYAFTFTYPYTLALFRDMGLAIFLVAGLLATLPALALPRSTLPVRLPDGRRLLAILAAGVVLAIVVLVAAFPWDGARPPSVGSIRAATYNIHYGYDTFWHLSLEAQARTIEASGAGVVLMQEVDAGRPTSYMIDDLLWLARRLDMEGVYLPTLEHLSGIGLLSRYPIRTAGGMLLPSELEQTGIVWAELDVDGVPVNAFGIWLGLESEERARQIDAALGFVAEHPGPAVFGGDFNATPDSPAVERVAGAGWLDPFAELGLGSPPTDPAIEPTKRIDYVWLRDLVPVAAEVLDSTASDHRLVVVEAVQP